MTSAVPRRGRLDLWGLFAGALAVRVLAALVLDGYRHPGLNEYEDIARSVVAGTGYRFYHLGVWYYSFAAPLFGGICAAIYWLGGTVGTVVALQGIVSAAHAVLIAVMAERLFASRRAGWLAGALMAVHPGLTVYASGKAHDLTFDALFFTLILFFCWRLHERPTVGRAIAAGVIVGIGAHSRGTAVVFLPVAAVWMLWCHRHGAWRHYLARMVVAGLCAVAVITPWATRNIRIHHAFVWMLTTDGESLWDGNNPNATGHSYARPDQLAQSRWFTDQALSFVREHPGWAAKLYAMKFYAFWWFSPQIGTLYARSWLLAYQAFYAGVLVLAALGVRSVIVGGTPARRQELVLLGLFLLALSALQSAYYVEGRHRWAIEPLLLIVAGGGAAWWWDAMRRRSSS